MNRENRGFAAASFVFLLLSGGVLSLLSLLFGWYDGFGLREALSLGNLLLPAVAGLLLVLRRPKPAALVMTLVLLIVLVLELPEIPRYLGPEGYLATYDEAANYTEYIPREYVTLPILDILVALVFAAAMYLRGRSALILAVLAAGAELAYMVLNIASLAYVTGHPTPFHLIIPLNYALGALFAGLYLRSLGKQTGEIKETEEA